MPKDLPAVLPLRPKTELPVAATAQTFAPPTARANTVAPAGAKERTVPPHLPSMTIRRADLATFVRFASRLASRAPMPPLRCCLFSLDSVTVTDLDVALRATLPGARDIGVVVPVPILKRFL